jgi:PAS domain S-box-containing protein
MATIATVPYFICPNCKDRSIDIDRRSSLLDDQPVGCRRCGFGFLFELMDDYYPSPGTGMLVCDREGRVLAAGDGVLELSGYGERELMGKDVMQALSLSGYADAQNPAKLALEWGVRRLGEQLVMTTRTGQEKQVEGDFFPAYDEDGGLLVALKPKPKPR